MTEPPFIFTTVIPYPGGWHATQYQGGRIVRSISRPTKDEAEVLATQWRDEQ